MREGHLEVGTSVFVCVCVCVCVCVGGGGGGGGGEWGVGGRKSFILKELLL